ncbi:related to Serine/threonine-protein kinase CBK1 [Ustilago trichophora]|uniref:non-specific serine/threonine protein kinase n=1 Tax=Ustilago trichophora TaxID=86804 RepID=A0A5C3EGK2_9BASI|nr:related to Serine/threonine-protein kinase CBK1 [Ustilago trichophora]
MTSESPPWQDRHDSIREVLQTKGVRAALRDFQISHSSVSSLCATSTNGSNTTKSDADISTSSLGTLLDISLVIAWSADGLPPSKDPNPFRAAAAPSLLYLRQASLQVQDFKTIKVLQKSAGSLVEVVKNRLDGRVYVLKSLVKGFARRNAAIQTPINETKLLQRQSSDSATTSGSHALQLLTPQLLAAFQTQNSVHVLMEYVPSGDFSELLMAASSCGAEYPGRASTGLLIEDWILRYSVDMIQAIAWVHAQGFAHRDIKPGNFLLDQSGHLKLCDFSSAAPFSDFGSSQSSGTPNRARHPLSRPDRKVWAFYCSQPTGTCDYLSPEVLEAEEKRVLERQQQYGMSSLDDILGLKRQNCLPSSSDAAAAPERSPGMYGPEVDWWSFGVMLYEMRFGVLPFFASRMEQTYEKIKDHRSSLKFDPAVNCSGQLRNLIQCLLIDAENRLGRISSEEIQQHGFYRLQNIDWSKQRPLQPPFTPNANVKDSTAGNTSGQEAGPINGIAARFPDTSLSLVPSLPSFSALYNGNPDDFPAFADSRELESESIRQQQSWWQGELDTTQHHSINAMPHQDDYGTQTADAGAALPDVEVPSMPRSSSSPAVVLSSASQSETLRDTSSYLAGAASPYVSRSAPRWSDCDTTFIGFSYLPQRDAFKSTADRPEGRSPGEMSTAASLDDLVPKTGASPNSWPASTPVASTPFHRGGSHSLTMLPTPPSFAPSPIAPQIGAAGSEEAENARRTSINLARSSALSFAQQQNFVTPARKPSYMAMHDRFRQMQGQEAPIPEAASANCTPAIPASPYPFPMASVARTSKFTGGKKTMLQRRDLDRARSATPGGGSVGSDSRQSGGSNAVREMSEREAWDEMMAAVQKSVRKKQPVAPVPPTPVASSAARTSGLPRSSTDPELSASKPVSAYTSRRTQLQCPADGLVSRRVSSRAALQPLDAPRQAIDKAKQVNQNGDDKPSLTVQPSGALRQRRSRANLIAPRATVKVIPPESPQGSPPGNFLKESPRPGVFPQGQYALDIDMYDSDGSDDSTVGRRNLKHRKSARQLLIRAQERSTPTKPKRAQSPPLTEAFASAPSVAAVLEAAGARSSPPILLSDQSVRSCNSSRDVSYEHGNDVASAPARVRAISIQRPDKASPDINNEVLSTSLGKTSVTFAPMAYIPVLGAIPPYRDAREGSSSLDGHSDQLGAPRESGRSAKTIRRKDSGEMLSQYRKAKGMGRATSMLSLSDRAKADAEAPSSRPGTALSSSPVESDGVDDFILGHVESRIRSMAPGGSLPGRTIRRFSSALSLKERERVTIERPASQDGAAKTSRGFGRFRSRIASSTLCEEPSEELLGEEAKSKTADRRAPAEGLARTRKGSSSSTNSNSNTTTDDQQIKPTTSRLGRRMGDTLPRSFAIRNSSASASTLRKTPLDPTLEVAQDGEPPGKADVSLMTGLNQRHNALQGSLLGLEARLARLKARLEN